MAISFRSSASWATSSKKTSQEQFYHTSKKKSSATWGEGAPRRARGPPQNNLEVATGTYQASRGVVSIRLPFKIPNDQEPEVPSPGSRLGHHQRWSVDITRRWPQHSDARQTCQAQFNMLPQLLFALVAFVWLTAGSSWTDSSVSQLIRGVLYISQSSNKFFTLLALLARY